MTTEIAERKPYPKNRKSRGSMIMARRTLVHGVGINDADYPTHTARCMFYRTWLGIMSRCYTSTGKYPHHEGCVVDPRWHSFMAFRAWMIDQDWVGKHLDKDLLVPGNKVYGPDTCVFVSPRVNSLLNTNPRARGSLPIGVYRASRSSWGGQCNLGAGMVHLGVRSTPLEAHQLWQIAKIQVIKDVASEQVDSRVHDRLLLEADLIEFELENNMETIR